MEVTPKLVNFTSTDHLVKDVVRISRSSLHTQTVSSQDLIVVHMTHMRQVVDDPFVKMKAPMCERVSKLGPSFALSGNNCQICKMAFCR
jgi:hypothetical protein